MTVEQAAIALGRLAAIHAADAVAKQAAVQPDKALLGQLADKSGNVLVLHVGVGVVLRPRGRVFSLAIVGQEAQTGRCLTVLLMALAVQDESPRRCIAAGCHEGLFGMVLDFLDAHAVVRSDGGCHAGGRRVVGRTRGGKGTGKGAFNFRKAERLARAVTLGDADVML